MLKMLYYFILLLALFKSPLSFGQLVELCEDSFVRLGYLSEAQNIKGKTPEFLKKIEEIKYKTLALQNEIKALNEKWESLDHKGQETRQEEIAKILSILVNKKLPVQKEIERLELEWAIRQEKGDIVGHQARLARALSKFKKELHMISKELKEMGY
jgi:chromosome segregation ATPase